MNGGRVNNLFCSSSEGSGQQCCYDKNGFLMMSYDQMWGSRPSRSHDFGFTPYNEANKVWFLLHVFFQLLWKLPDGLMENRQPVTAYLVNNVYSYINPVLPFVRYYIINVRSLTGAITISLVPRYDSLLPVLYVARGTGCWLWNLQVRLTLIYRKPFSYN